MHGASSAMGTALTDSTTDATLAARAADGDDAAFERIMRRHNRLLFRTARGILKSDAEAEDALQEAYLRAWRALGSFRSEARLSTWLVRIVINEALGRLRRRSSQVLAFDATIDLSEVSLEDVMEGNPDDRPDRAAMRSEVRAMMEACIDALPEAFRTVFMLRAVEEMSVQEVSAALGLAGSHRAHALLPRSRPASRGLGSRYRSCIGRCFLLRRCSLRPHREECDGEAARQPRRFRRLIPQRPDGNLNLSTSSARPMACSFKAEAAAAVSSTNAAFCCVMRSSSFTAAPT
jgi:RNA polymerase sigma-70 factor, ECF subfamily